MNGKGSVQRPAQISERDLAKRWSAIFGRATGTRATRKSNPRQLDIRTSQPEHTTPKA